MLLGLFIPAWYLFMALLVSHKPLHFKLFSSGVILRADGRELSLITAGMNSLTLIVGFAVFVAVRRALPLDRRLVFAGYRQTILVAAKAAGTAMVAAGVALYAALVLLAYWRPTPAGWLAVLASFAVMAAEYGALGMLLGVLVKGDLEGFFLIIMGGLIDTFLQNPVGNPVANRPVLEYFPSFGPTQFASSVAFGGGTQWGELGLGTRVGGRVSRTGADRLPATHAHPHPRARSVDSRCQQLAVGYRPCYLTPRRVAAQGSEPPWMRTDAATTMNTRP